MSVSTEDEINAHKLVWLECELAKEDPRTLLREISKRQKSATKALQAYMKDTDCDILDCGSGWSLASKCKEHTTFTEDVCGSYMSDSTMEKLKTENTQQRISFATRRPAKQGGKKRKSTEDE